MRQILSLLLVIYAAAAVDIAAAAHLRASNVLVPDLLSACLLLMILPRSSSTSVILGGALGLLIDALGAGPLGVGMIVAAALVPLLRRALRRHSQPPLTKLVVVTMLAVTFLILSRTAARVWVESGKLLEGPDVMLAAGRGAATALLVLAIALPGRAVRLLRPPRKLART
ncbi:rod shape-determining protein MreD [Maioricimonas rarisocia]|uniref:Rod shape-determining protein MreD n=1 Tax=Maioricimonas rarisocia TaxID=2528026 RepID=A0A517Z2S0_9PLAN|nr:rod shape-determining protein MreD [Maioricimonas rarisocia]QDU36759.1 rod shape-determining protein MreD [Maioricimonas rarisocia]